MTTIPIVDARGDATPVAQGSPISATRIVVRGQPHTVLVVDDYPAVLAWAARAFEQAGWTVITAVDGHEAQQRWDNAKRDHAPVELLVTDLELPGLDGASLARTLRACDPTLAVIAISGAADQREGWNGPLLDRTAFFRKPVRAVHMLAAAAALVEANDDSPESESSPPEDL